MAIQVCQTKKLTLAERLYLPAIFMGMKLTFYHIFTKKVTVEYPDQELDFAANYRGVHRLNKDSQGRIKCVACEMCAAACPAHCITIKATDVEWDDRDKIPKIFEIDELKCIFCGYCVEACPKEAISMTKRYHMVSRSREDMQFDLDKLLTIFDETKDEDTLDGPHFGMGKKRPTDLSAWTKPEAVSPRVGTLNKVSTH